MVSIGIDIGTTNTVVATVGPNGDVYAHRFDTAPLLQSFVYLEPPNGYMTFGRPGETLMSQNRGGWGYRRWKLDMGENRVLATHDFGTKRVVVTPESLTTWLVEHVVEQFASGVGGQEVDDVVVTVPHGWRRSSPHKVIATRTAAAAARVNGSPLRVRDRAVDEPVAAAAYWLHAVKNREAFVDHTVLVVDIGGGTFDLSLVRVGPHERPLVVVDAINNNVAGDFVTALVLVNAFRGAPAGSRVQRFLDPQAILDTIASGAEPWLLEAFRQAEEAMRKTSTSTNSAEDRGRDWGPAPAPYSLVGPDSEVIQADLRARHFGEVAEPFYASGRDLLRSFLQLQMKQDLPVAVMFAGGGSRIGGVRRHIVQPVLAEILGEESSSQALTRIAMNTQVTDVAIALGAALIANDLESVEERLLYDVGIHVMAPPELAKHLGVDPGAQDRVPIIMSPTLAKGATLPVRYSSSDGGVPLQLARKVPVEVTVITFDDPLNPHRQRWTSDEANGAEVVQADLEVWASPDGVLGVTVRPRGGSEITFEGRLERARERLVPQALEIAAGATKTDPSLPAIRTPEQIERAAAALNAETKR